MVAREVGGRGGGQETTSVGERTRRRQRPALYYYIQRRADGLPSPNTAVSSFPPRFAEAFIQNVPKPRPFGQCVAWAGDLIR